MIPRLAVAACFASCALLVAAPAHAGPDPGDDFSKALLLQLRGTCMLLPAAWACGGDVHVGIEGNAWGLQLGLRGATGEALDGGFQLVAADIGARGFVDPRAATGWFFGGGLTGGGLYTSYAQQTGSTYGAYGEAGLDWPRTSRVRLTTALRLDLGAAGQNDFSRVAPAPDVFIGLSLNIGVVLGGLGADRTAAAP